MKEVEFTVYGEPKGKGRPRFSKTKYGVRTFTPADTRNYEAFVKISYINEVGSVKLNGAISADITGVFPIPKSVSKKQRILMEQGKIPYTKKIDIDNLCKSILDSVNGIAYDDDKQIVELTAHKMYGVEPCVKVKFKEIAESE